jgi:hypothetical protein
MTSAATVDTSCVGLTSLVPSCPVALLALVPFSWNNENRTKKTAEIIETVVRSVSGASS